ncbi:O-methyltransferase [Olivibacter domesticus]|uniref:Methyltransferase domain-containing protein n=1 Tax=Olivibacter domesticus TaxID=407022 RepID=A0A1H7LXB7_OLID1|nr:class I SAM-dependent methyltransferase [Olivibacter domesticus]SEL03125.1 Methyltransferase domain-containing protein [Olivibacter domesticus]
MNQEINQPFPSAYTAILEATKKAGFSMASEVLTCSLLRTLASSKTSAKFLELGTGTGLSTTWILAGMDQASSLVSIDNDSAFLNIASNFLSRDKRLELVLNDGAVWIEENRNQRFDYIFADTWHGKYLLLDEVLDMMNPGGFYIIDDMLPQANWPEGHQEKALNLIKDLEKKENLAITKLMWASGIIIAVKK